MSNRTNALDISESVKINITKGGLYEVKKV